MSRPVRTVLIVDDNAADRYVVRRYLLRDQDYEYTIEEASTAEQGLAFCQTRRPDCLLVDYNLPGMNGREFLLRLQAEGWLHLPFVILTGSGDETTAVEVLKAGAQDYLVKERVTRETLLIAVNNAIDKVELYGKLDKQREDLTRQNEELKQREGEIQALNQMLRRAMAESHHRIKNNLQVLAALVDIQAADQPPSEAATALERMSRHIRAMASLHELLTHEAIGDSVMATLPVTAAMEKLLPLLQATAGGRTVAEQIDAEGVIIPIKEATSLILLVSELVSNALKHSGGDVRIDLREHKGIITLEVCDDGPGFPEGFDVAKASNTGLELVLALTQHDLGGEVRFMNQEQGGARIVVTFSLRSTPDLSLRHS